jgi:hypothetical protein
MLEQFQQLSTGAKLVGGAIVGGSFLTIIALINTRAFGIAVLGLALIAGAILLWRLWLKWQTRKRAAALNSQLTEHSSTAPSSISDPARRAKLDDLRQNFAKGIERFRAVGKDLYSLPWYVVCGEPGSGKTEAVRHCNVGFPPGLQDEMQGAGGTLNMHWWFTNQAVLLDTAGKLLFQEAPPGSTTEWTEFLNLLRRARPNCPINGLLLVIPSESLIRDSFEDIQKKAAKIEQQLSVIQQRLDVRFPVFVLITKCDLINGFREFFAGIKDPQLQHQMTGWSNPAPLDAPFQPDAVDQHLQQVVQRISRRRLGLMKDPVPGDPGARRIDEVDALFTLPSSIAALAPRLRRYLETIFVGNAWSGRPLFLRGIYFTSALTEGSALDAELASALGIPAESLPEGKAWERERSFFLRDLFVQKIFKEQGLVTRSSDTRSLVRRRQWILGSVVACGLVGLVVLSLIGRNALRESIGEELAMWRAGARAEDWTGPRWHPIVDNGLNYLGNDPVRLEGNREWPLVEFHEKLQQRVAADLRIPWVFKPIETIAVRANPSRRRAQQVLFEASIVGPLVEATRERLLNESNWATADLERLATLVELEGAIHLRGLPGYSADFPADEFITPMLAPSLAAISDRDAVLDRLLHIHDWTYARGGAGRGKWPPAWLSRGRALRDNPPIARALDTLERGLQDAQSTQREAFQTVQDGRLTLIRFLDAEKALLAAAAAPRNDSNWASNVLAAGRELENRRQAVDALVAELRTKTGISGEVTLDAGYRAAVERVRGGVGRTAQRLREAMLKQREAAEAAAQASTGPATEFTLYRDLQRRLNALDTRVTSLLEQALPPSEQAQLVELDAVTLRTASDAPAYAVRVAAYQEALGRLEAATSTRTSRLGRLGEILRQEGTATAAAREQLSAYAGPMRQEFTTGHGALLEGVAVVGGSRLLGAYRTELENYIGPNAAYPFGAGPALAPADFRAARDALTRASRDAADQAVPADARRALEESFARVEPYAAFANAIADGRGDPVSARLVLIRDRDQVPTVDRALGPPKGQRIPLARVYPSLRFGGRDFRARGLVENIEIGRYSVAQTLPAIEFSTTPDPRPEPDARFEPPAGWSLIRLLQGASNRRSDGLEWDTVVVIREDDAELPLAMGVIFEKPLPPRDQWPVVSP